ncbi:hypothetical protein ACGTJS_03690 [Faucicola mancuniensis]|uniref:hypothetical protein n=1 Tax=Faucicola mancuniensis TaxID=1309795 RepID=UPI0028EB3BD7|nr:hypothetical protein [uncultured Moraxella sp.]
MPLQFVRQAIEDFTDFKILSDSKLEGKADRAEQAIDILNLNNDRLSNIRKDKYDYIFMIQSQLPLTEEITEDTTVSDQLLNFQQLDEYLKIAFGDTAQYYEYLYILKKLA